MTRSIFDPTGSDTEHSGTRNLGPDAGDVSQMPSDVTDGKVEHAQSAPTDQNDATDKIASAEADVERDAKRNPDREQLSGSGS